jgi:hypothetical protein
MRMQDWNHIVSRLSMESASFRSLALKRSKATLAMTAAPLGSGTMNAQSKSTAPSVTFSSKPKPTFQTKALTIGCLVFPRQDQIDFTCLFEVFSRIPNSTVHVIAKT